MNPRYPFKKEIEALLEKVLRFVHEETPFFLDFLVPPLSVGEEPVKEIFKIKNQKDNLLKG